MDHAPRCEPANVIFLSLFRQRKNMGDSIVPIQYLTKNRHLHPGGGVMAADIQFPCG